MRNLLFHSTNEKNGTIYDLEALEKERSFESDIYKKRQKGIEETLNLSKDVNAIGVLIENLRNEQGFIVYKSIKDAEEKNEFIVL